MDRAALEALDREFAAGNYGHVDGMLVIRHGAVVYEKTYDHAKEYERLFAGKDAPGTYNYYDPGWHPYYKRGPLHTMRSVSKSVTSALIGIAIVVPELDLIAVFTGWNIYDKKELDPRLAFERVAAAVETKP